MKAVMELRKMPLRGVLFFSGMFVFVWLAVEPRLIYHSFGMLFGYPEFSTGWAFFKEVVAAPGGVVEYVGGFLSQWFCFSGLGAGIITMSAWSFYYLTGSLVALCGGRRDNILCYLPAIGLTATYSAYSHPLNLCLAMLTSLLFVVVYERIPFRRNVSKGAVFVIFAAVLYYIAGGASVFFVVLAAACEIVMRRGVRFGLVMLAVGLAAIRLVIFCFVDIPARQAYTILLPIDPETAKQTGSHSAVLVSGVYCFVFLFVLLMALRQRKVASKASGRQTRAQRKRKALKGDMPGKRFSSGRTMWVIQSVLLVGITVAAVGLAWDRDERQLLRISSFARDQKWPDVLRAAQKTLGSSYNVFCNHDINRALFHTGRLGSDLFSYPQHPSALLLITGIQGRSTIRDLKGSDMFLELGDVNFAEQLAYETLELRGDNPHVLDRLARMSIVKGQTETARVFLGALSKDLVYGDYAEGLIQRLDNDSKLTGDKTIEHLRNCMLVADEAVVNYDEETLLGNLLERNRHNRMAFEYLMAYYLLTGRHEKITENIQYFRDLGYDKIPRCYEEAIALDIAMSQKEPNMHGWTISNRTVQRYEAFNSVGRNPIYSRLDPRGLKEVLARDFADTYFFYYLFGLSRLSK